MEQQEDKRIVAGYFFAGEEDADLARQEEKKIAYLESHMDYSAPEKVLVIYRKSIEERLFKTPVGYDFLRHMQDFLMHSEEIPKGQIPPIRMYVNFKPRMRRETNPTINRIAPRKEERKISPLPISIMLNVVLALAVCGMFWIALKGDNPNILNYETALRNQYSAWEQELTEREQVIREKERELRINQE